MARRRWRSPSDASGHHAAAPRSAGLRGRVGVHRTRRTHVVASTDVARHHRITDDTGRRRHWHAASLEPCPTPAAPLRLQRPHVEQMDMSAAVFIKKAKRGKTRDGNLGSITARRRAIEMLPRYPGTTKFF